jgi:hypothetical protein
MEYASTPQYAFMAWCSVKKQKITGTTLPFYIGEVTIYGTAVSTSATAANVGSNVNAVR